MPLLFIADRRRIVFHKKIMCDNNPVISTLARLHINPLDSKGYYSATSNNTKLVHWPLMGGLLHLVQ